MSFVMMHNDNPAALARAEMTYLNLLLFRGSSVSYGTLDLRGFEITRGPRWDNRFPDPYIIRDKWQQKNVTTRMQTKNIVAVTKSVYLALEYAFGNNGYFYAMYVERGIDVVNAVREWEAQKHWAQIDPGNQQEVVTTRIPKQYVLGCWKIRNIDHKNMNFMIEKIQVASSFDIPEAIKDEYRALSARFPENTYLNTHRETHAGPVMKNNADDPRA